MKFPCWVDGALCSAEDARICADDSAYTEGRGCYTSARVTRGEVRFEARHTERLVRDARAIGLHGIDPQGVSSALRQLAAAAFSEDEGIVRLQASRDAAGAVHLVGVARALGDDRPEWRAIRAPQVHDGGVVAGGPKLAGRLVLALAWEAARAAGAQEALLFDREGYLVEGSRSNLIVCRADGALVTPPLARGAVAGIARAILLARMRELREADVVAGELPKAREIIAVNAVRGARPIVTLDTQSVGEGPRPLLARLADALA